MVFSPLIRSGLMARWDQAEHVYDKTGVTNRAGAAPFAVRNGLVTDV